MSSLVLVAAVIGSWPATAQTESIPQAVDRMDGTLEELDRKYRNLERKLRELGERVRELERAAEREKAADPVASRHGTTSVAQPASGDPESVEASLNLTRADYVLVQHGLASLGFAPGAADGLVGPKTRRALRTWQASKEFEATGYLTHAQTQMLVAAGTAAKAEAERLARDRKPPGTVFRDCPECPEMMVVPAGSFMMGSPPDETGHSSDESPRHLVTIGRPFAVGRHEVTFEQWETCRQARGCKHRPVDRGWGRRDRPVIFVTWDHAQQYVRWLSGRTGERYRLPSESEWEYAARGGTSTRYFWGDSIGDNRANCNACGSRWDWARTAPVGSFAPNRYGLHDFHGNVAEWVMDCWHGNYSGAPGDGNAWTSGGDCSRRVVRGGSWGDYSTNLRSAYRGAAPSELRSSRIGFRVARTLD